MPQQTATSDRHRFDPITIRTDDATKVTGLSRSTIERLRKSGVIKSKTIGRSVLLDYASVKALCVS